ncbi:hypothetical protein C7T94_09455 [Pedobacter yulinensis]|uniref:DUF4382 domain-containing protein n=1 Tax=Pedobacter yulinensis TaxID=2126353 RepID=A0A2T3HK99_9SPHI|nr:DUF4382 domain-containing protein [Pedobacter yulinensis]PST82854.1 hypothetical protein C7T94_09455 [Pedobacter yulinensis]
MKTKINYRLTLTTLVAGLFLFVSCSKEKQKVNGTTRVAIKMTDAPGNFDAINLNVKEIVLVSGSTPYTFAAQSGIFNILDYRMGTTRPDILVASGEMPSGDITEIRLVLNDAGNTIVVDGVEQELKTPSAQSSGWKVKLTEAPTLVPGVAYTLLLDFDAARSIVPTGNGKFLLKPVVRGVQEATTGLVSGTVIPLDTDPEVLVISGTDTVGTVADPVTGQFTIGGLAAGNYTVKLIPANGYRESTINNVRVALGSNTDLGTVTLRK